MTATTISVSGKNRRELARIKQETGSRNMDQVIDQLLRDHNLLQLRRVQEDVAKRMKKLGLKPADLLATDLLE